MTGYEYDIAMSLAKEDRIIAQPIAQRLGEYGYAIFYDLWEQDTLLGKALLKYLDHVYRSAARHCLVFVSAAYASKAWTTFELRSALARAIGDDQEYILPLRIDDTQLPGLNSSIGYLDLRTASPDDVISILQKKLGSPISRSLIRAHLTSGDKNRRLLVLSQIWINRDLDYLNEVKHLLRSDPDPEIRAKSAWVLDNYRDISSKDILLDALNDHDRNVRYNAGCALMHLGRDVVEDVQRVLRLTESHDTREMANMILLRI
jgi:hypothetical protein